MIRVFAASSLSVTFAIRRAIFETRLEVPTSLAVFNFAMPDAVQKTATHQRPIFR